MSSLMEQGLSLPSRTEVKVWVYSHARNNTKVASDSSARATEFSDASLKLPLKAASKNDECWLSNPLCTPKIFSLEPTMTKTKLV